MTTLRNLYYKPILLKGGGPIFDISNYQWYSSNPNMNTAEGRYGDAEARILNLLNVQPQLEFINRNGRVQNLSNFWNAENPNMLGIDHRAPRCESVRPMRFEIALENYIRKIKHEEGNEAARFQLDEIIHFLGVSVNNRFYSGRAWVRSFPEYVGGIFGIAADGHINFYRAMVNAKRWAIYYRDREFPRSNIFTTVFNMLKARPPRHAARDEDEDEDEDL